MCLRASLADESVRSRIERTVWNPYVPTVWERLLCVYYWVSMTIVGTVWRLPFDAWKLVRITWPLIFLAPLVGVEASTFWYSWTALLLIPSALRICKGVFYPICAGYALGHTWEQKVSFEVFSRATGLFEASRTHVCYSTKSLLSWPMFIVHCPGGLPTS